MKASFCYCVLFTFVKSGEPHGKPSEPSFPNGTRLDSLSKALVKLLEENEFINGSIALETNTSDVVLKVYPREGQVHKIFDGLSGGDEPKPKTKKKQNVLDYLLRLNDKKYKESHSENKSAQDASDSSDKEDLDECGSNVKGVPSEDGDYDWRETNQDFEVAEGSNNNLKSNFKVQGVPAGGDYDWSNSDQDLEDSRDYRNQSLPKGKANVQGIPTDGDYDWSNSDQDLEDSRHRRHHSSQKGKANVKGIPADGDYDWSNSDQDLENSSQRRHHSSQKSKANVKGIPADGDYDWSNSDQDIDVVHFDANQTVLRGKQVDRQVPNNKDNLTSEEVQAARLAAQKRRENNENYAERRMSKEEPKIGRPENSMLRSHLKGIPAGGDYDWSNSDQDLSDSKSRA